ncbi:MAG: hypothetical protein MHMPM18_004832 [Marteilia pararefringens]
MAEDNFSDPKEDIITNTDKDELYDEFQDDNDRDFIDELRRAYLCLNTEDKLPETDGILNCPACFTPLCYDCQQHTKFKNQFRALFVLNCKVDRAREKSYDFDDGPSVYNYVYCSYCSTDVGYFGEDECYFFNNVLVS